MSETDPKRKPPRFPYVAALLCAACLGAAAWTWMRYSYCWDVTVKYVHDGTRDIAEHKWPRSAHVRFPAVWDGAMREGEEWLLQKANLYRIGDPDRTQNGAYLWSYLEQRPVARQKFLVVGRVLGTIHDENGPYRRSPGLVLAPTVTERFGRFHPASIAGLLVGAMGVFVFTVALQHWLRERGAAMALEAP